MSGYKLPLNFGTKQCMWNYEIAMETCSVKFLDEVNKSKAHKLIIIGWGFRGIQNNRWGRDYQPKPTAEADNPYQGLDYFGK